MQIFVNSITDLNKIEILVIFYSNNENFCEFYYFSMVLQETKLVGNEFSYA